MRNAVLNEIPETDVQGACVLVLNDPNFDGCELTDMLETDGQYFVAEAYGVEEAEELINDLHPDVIVLNLFRDKESQLTACRTVLAKVDADTPIVSLMRRDDKQTRLRAFRYGVSEIITAPVSENEFLLRTQRVIERRNMTAKLRREQQRLTQDMRAAQAMQGDLLQKEDTVASIASARHIAIETFYKSSNLLGGDWWHVLPIDKDSVGLLMFDFSGHGVTSAINAFRLQLFVESLKDNRFNPSVWMKQLNKELHAVLSVGQFATGFYGVFNRRNRKLCYVNAGTPLPMIIRAQTGAIEGLEATSPILGCSSEVDFDSRTVSLSPNDRLVLYSDALYEDFVNPDATLSFEELGGYVCAAAKLKADDETFPQSLLRFMSLSENSRFEDDLTIISMQVLAKERKRNFRRLKPIKDCIWIAMEEGSTLADSLLDFISTEHPEWADLLHFGATLPKGSTVALIVADESNLKALDVARDNDADFLNTVLLSDDQQKRSDVSYMAPANADLETVMSVIKAANTVREQTMNLRAEVALRKSAIGAIRRGVFSIATLEQARNLSTMLALACPEPSIVAIGLQELMVNAVEHGNLGITADEKQDLLIKGQWRTEVYRRLELPEYKDREVTVGFRRYEDRIVFRIEDEGEGFDYEALQNGTVAGEDSFRGRGIKLATDLSFSRVVYEGQGNIVEAIIDLS